MEELHDAPVLINSYISSGKLSSLILLTLTCYLLLKVINSLSAKQSSFGRKVDRIDGPWSLPWIGCPSLIFTLKKDVFTVLNSMTEKYKGCFRVWVLNDPTIFVASPKMVHKVLVENAQVQKSDMYDILKFMFGKGLVTSDVPTWKRHRELIQPWLQPENDISKNYLNHVNKHTNVFCQVMRAYLDKVEMLGMDKNEHDLFPFFHRVLFDIVTDALSGKCAESQEILASQYADMGKRTKSMLMDKWLNPHLRNKWIWAVHPLRRVETEMLNMVTNFVKERIVLRRQRGTSKPETLMDYFIQARDQNEFSDEELQQHMNTFTVTGHNSSAAALLNFSFMMGNNCNVQQKLQKELDQVIGKDKDRPLTHDDLKRMKYLDQCLKETLRLFPSIPLIMRTLTADIVSDVDPILLPKNSRVAIWIPGLHRNPQVFPDPEKYIPERFTPENMEKFPPGAYIPFSDGPRGCIAQHLPEMQLKGVLAKFFLNFSIKLDKWKIHRKILTPAVNGRILEDFLEIVNEDCVKFCRAIKTEMLTKLNEGNLESSEMSKMSVDLRQIFHNLFMGMIIETVVGVRDDYLEGSPDAPFLIEHGENVKNMMLARSVNPLLRFDWLWKFHPLAKKIKTMQDDAHEWYLKSINTRRAQLKKQDENIMKQNSNGARLRQAILDTLLEFSDDPNNDVTDEYLAYELNTFVLGGHDTTSETMSIVVYMLAIHPELQEKVYQETLQVFGNDIQRPATLADLSRLPYMEQFIKETQRMFPVVPMVMRKTGSEVVLEEGCTVPAGTTVGVWSPGLHRDTRVFPNPEKFDPDHFSEEACKNMDQYAFNPYSGGLRNCIGKRLSVIQMKVILSRLLLHYKLVGANPNKMEDVRWLPRVIMGPSKRFQYYLEERK
ncbi:Cytochrome P450 4C1 [Orchesella cincta]|uniref:Cytochrome P450 4C1 n=1 Tax=Orchesella cincta TaxID=48709 RepID=A0A1D2N4N6_ORCCI|nr:Cytochrome P450 4C1 [Orchesella cincta]